MSEKAPKRPQEEKTPQAAEAASETRQNPLRGLDLSQLDLTVEKVDERISPSETNVFDK